MTAQYIFAQNRLFANNSRKP